MHRFQQRAGDCSRGTRKRPLATWSRMVFRRGAIAGTNDKLVQDLRAARAAKRRLKRQKKRHAEKAAKTVTLEFPEPIEARNTRTPQQRRENAKLRTSWTLRSPRHQCPQTRRAGGAQSWIQLFWHRYTMREQDPEIP